jgi:RNA polymerase sigma factor (sigma-70 family)
MEHTMANIENPAQEKFSQATSDLFNPNNFSANPLLKYVKRLAGQYPGSDPKESLQQAIHQGLEYTMKTGIEIQNPAAWLRVAVRGILNNQVRNNKRQKNLTDKWTDIHPTTYRDPSENLEFEEQIELIYRSLQNLSTDDREILDLYLCQNKSYEEIQNYYGHINIEIGTIRQRVSRAKKRLKNEFHSLIADPGSKV